MSYGLVYPILVVASGQIGYGKIGKLMKSNADYVEEGF